jgi:heat shock protein HslJ
MRTKTMTTLLVLALTLGACGRGPVPPAGATDSTGDELRGTKWVVDTIVDGQSASSAPAGAEAHVVFGDGDRFRGSTGCNAMGGRSLVHDDTPTITFSEVITTKMACADDRMRLERAVLGTLRGDVAYEIDADVLRLDGPDGHGLRLRAAPAG